MARTAAVGHDYNCQLPIRNIDGHMIIVIVGKQTTDVEAQFDGSFGATRVKDRLIVLLLKLFLRRAENVPKDFMLLYHLDR